MAKESANEIDDKNLGLVKLPNVRLAFASLDTLDTGKAGEWKPRYKATFLIPKNSPHGKKLKALIDQAIEEAKEAKWGDKIPKIKQEKIALADGDDFEYDGFEDHWAISAARAESQGMPALKDSEGNKVKSESEAEVYSGCYVHAIVRFYGSDAHSGNQINCSIEGVKKYKEGARFAGTTLDDDAFDDLDFEDDDDDDLV